MEHERNDILKSALMRDLDSTLHDMERNARELAAENRELRKEVRALEHAAFLKDQDHFNKMIAGGLLACIGQPSVESVGPAAVTMLARIREMRTIEEVHLYVEEFMESAKRELGETTAAA